MRFGWLPGQTTPRWSKDIENSRGIQEVYIVNSPHFKHFHSITANLHLNCFSELEDAPLFTFFLGDPISSCILQVKKIQVKKSRGGRSFRSCKIIGFSDLFQFKLQLSSCSSLKVHKLFHFRFQAAFEHHFVFASEAG